MALPLSLHRSRFLSPRTPKCRCEQPIRPGDTAQTPGSKSLILTDHFMSGSMAHRSSPEALSLILGLTPSLSPTPQVGNKPNHACDPAVSLSLFFPPFMYAWCWFRWLSSTAAETTPTRRFPGTRAGLGRHGQARESGQR